MHIDIIHPSEFWIAYSIITFENNHKLEIFDGNKFHYKTEAHEVFLKNI